MAACTYRRHTIKWMNHLFPEAIDKKSDISLKFRKEKEFQTLAYKLRLPVGNFLVRKTIQIYDLIF